MIRKIILSTFFKLLKILEVNFFAEAIFRLIFINNAAVNGASLSLFLFESNWVRICVGVWVGVCIFIDWHLLEVIFFINSYRTYYRKCGPFYFFFLHFYGGLMNEWKCIHTHILKHIKRVHFHYVCAYVRVLKNNFTIENILFLFIVIAIIFEGAGGIYLSI